MNVCIGATCLYLSLYSMRIKHEFVIQKICLQANLMMEAERDSSVMFAGKLEANDHSYGCQPPEVWEQLQQEVSVH